MIAISLAHVSVCVKRHFFSRSRKLLDDICFELPQGSLCAFLGPNGAGKTTAIRCALGLLRPDAGEVRLHGLPARMPQARAGLGYLPERAYYPPTLTAWEFVFSHCLLAGLRLKDTRKLCGQALHDVGLDGHLHRRLGSFSKGMLQRAGLAAVIAGQPRLLILDEPLSGLDPRGRHDVRELIAHQRTLGRTVLFSTHILADVALICDRVAILGHGRITHEGTPAQLAAQAQTEHTKVEVASSQVSHDLCQKWAAAGYTYRRLPDSCVFEAANEQAANELLDLLRQQGATIRHLQPLGGGLEQLFL